VRERFAGSRQIPPLQEFGVSALQARVPAPRAYLRIGADDVVVTEAAPPPETVTEFTNGEAALLAMFTVTVMEG
jgi:hypothetical protein